MPTLRYDLSDAEEKTGLSHWRLRQLIRAGKLTAYRPGGTPRSKIFFDENELDAFIESKKYQPEPQAEDRQRDKNGRYQPVPT